VALCSAILLWQRENGPHGHGLELARTAKGATVPAAGAA